MRQTPANRILALALGVVVCLSILTATGYAKRDYRVKDNPAWGKRFQAGMASWYGDGGALQGKPTASGEAFDKHDLTAAHRTLPVGSEVRVVNRTNGKSVVVRITDRGPKSRRAIIDLSKQAARELGALHKGLFPVALYVVKQAPAEAKDAPPIAPKPPKEKGNAPR